MSYHTVGQPWLQDLQVADGQATGNYEKHVAKALGQDKFLEQEVRMFEIPKCNGISKEGRIAKVKSMGYTKQMFAAKEEELN